MYLLIIYLPLLNSIILGFLGHRLRLQTLLQIGITNIVLTTLLAYWIFYDIVLQGNLCYIDLGNWINTTVIKISWNFLFDPLTSMMLIVITSISLCVHFYSIEYMSEDPHIPRFISYLSLFTFFMIMLVLAGNLLQMFLGWEGVGLCSYLLINFWFQRIQANKAAIKAMIINRVGDFGLALGIFIFFYIFKTLDYTSIFSLTAEINEKTMIFRNIEINALSLACFFLLIGCVGKSAQVGLHTWLPDAMEGPTPVSALIHAATMVTAGIFLVSRCSYAFQYTPNVSFIITILGAFTAFLAGTTGLAQNDLKRVIAYSTCSQLGYMLFVSGVSNYNISFFHLSNHAFFKALLFLSAGSVIHGMADEQDMRKMGGLSDFLVFTCSCMAIGSAALEGFPFSTGFYSKDMILELAGVFFSVESTFAAWFGEISVATTAFYSTRSLFYTFIDEPLGFKKSFMNCHESGFIMGLPLFVLSVSGLIVGYLSKDIIIGIGINNWNESIFIKTEEWTFFEAEYLDSFIKDIPLFFGFIGGLSASFLYSEEILHSYFFNWKTSNFGRKLYTFFNRKWFFDKVYNEIIGQNILSLAYTQTYQNMDRGLIELIGPHGIGIKLYNQTTMINRISISYLYHYVWLLLMGSLLILTGVVFWYKLIFWLDLRIFILLLITFIINRNFFKIN